MIITKNLECILTISDTNVLFSKRLNDELIKLLKEKYQNKCYSSCYILNINKINRRSFLNCNENLDANFNISLQFEAEVLLYQENEIIHGCSIIKKENNGIVHGKSKYCGIQINMNQDTTIYNVGDVVPVIVKMLRYNINQSEISVLAIPFVPLMYNIVLYNTINDINDKTIDTLLSLNNKVLDLDKKIKDLDKNSRKIYDFFKDLLSNDKLKDKNVLEKTFRSSQIDKNNIDIIKKYNTIELDKLLNELKNNKKQNYILFKPYNSFDINYCNIIKNNHLSEKLFTEDDIEYKTNKNINEYNILTVNESIENIIELYIYENIRNKQCLLEFIDNYPTLNDIQKVKKNWKLYMLLKNNKKDINKK